MSSSAEIVASYKFPGLWGRSKGLAGVRVEREVAGWESVYVNIWSLMDDASAVADRRLVLVSYPSKLLLVFYHPGAFQFYLWGSGRRLYRSNHISIESLSRSPNTFQTTNHLA